MSLSEWVAKLLPGSEPWQHHLIADELGARDDEITRLRAENEALKKQVKNPHRHTISGEDYIFVLHDEWESLRAELSEAERDAARYRLIRDCLWSPIKDDMELQIGPLYFLRSDYQPKDIDWTIDAAMEREEG